MNDEKMTAAGPRDLQAIRRFAADTSARERRPYRRPRVLSHRLLPEAIRMPGGSGAAEGQSGKAHPA